MVQEKKTPLVVIVGETASGKSALALEIAEQFKGEIIAADSRTVYKGMDIGTAKPTREDQALIPHHLLDITTPDKPITVADFKKLANKAIDDISARGKLPILVGGTGLYIDAVIFDFQFNGVATDTALREQLSGLSVTELQNQLRGHGISLPENERNPRHLQRALETKGQRATRKPLRKNTLIIGLQPDREALQERISQRVDAMVEAGLVAEVGRLGKQYGWGTEVLRIPAYRTFREYVQKTISVQEAKEQCIKYDLALAKRQRTWFRRNESIHWLQEQSEAVDLITTFLNK
jgi:tRNA dimethylallyltransferase